MAYIIAEIGFNHEGDLPLAVEMIQAAAEVGADAVKFQTFRAIDLALPTAPHYEAIACGQMTLEQHQELAAAAKESGVEFLSTPFSPWAVELLEKVGVRAYKVASMDCTNRHLLGYIAQTGKPIYLSTGMATLAEIGETLELLEKIGVGPVTIFHCLSLYPAQAGDLNLEIIPLLSRIFGVPVGYSDHYPGTKACLAAVMLGAQVIETHFTLDPFKEGGDHQHSVDPPMLEQLTIDIDLFHQMRGDGQAIYHRPDRSLAQDYRRGMYAARDIVKGGVVCQEDLLFCRPTSQLAPNDLERLGRMTLTRDVAVFEEIQKMDLV